MKNSTLMDSWIVVDKKRQAHRISGNRVVLAKRFNCGWVGWPMSKRVCTSLVSALIPILLCAVSVSAQRITGDIDGDVTDSSGAAVPNVVVTAVNINTGLTRSATTSSSGTYTLAELPI